MTMTEDEDRGEPAEGIRRQEEEQEPAEGIRQQEKESSPQSFPSYSPKEQRPSRRAREPSPIEDDDYSLDLLLGEVFGTEIDQTPPLAPRKKMVTTTAQLEEDGDADPRDTNQTKEDNQTRGTSRQTRRKTRDDSAQMELLEEIVDLSPETGRTTVPSTRAVSTMTMTMTEDEDRGEPAEGIRRQEEEQEPAEGIRQQEKESSPQSFPSYSPKEQRPSRRAREPSPIEDDDYSLDLLLGEVFGTEIDQTPPLAPRKKMVTTTAQLEEDGDADPRDTNQTKEDNQTRGTSRQTRRKTRDDSAQMELLEEIVDLSPETGRTTVPSTRAVSTMTMTMTEDEDRGEPAEGIRRQEEEQEPAEGIRQQEKESSPQSFPSYSPKEQRPSRRAREPSPIEDDDYSLDLLLGEVFGTEIDQTPPLAPRKKMVTTTAQLEEDGDADPRDTNQTKEDNQTRGTSRQTRRKTRDDSAQMELLEEIVDLSPETGRTTVPSTRAVSTMTMTMTEDEDRGEPAEGIRRQEEEQEPAEGIRQQEKESSPQSFPSYSPKEQRPSRRAREPSPIEDDDYSLDLLLGEVFGTEIDQTPPLAPRKKMVTTTAQLEEDGDADPRDTNQTKEDNQTRGTSRQTRRKTRDDSAQMELLEEIVDLSPETGRTTVPSTRAVSTMTMTMTEDEDRGEPAEGIRRQEEEQEPAEGIRQQEKESSPQSFPSYSPKEQRPSRRAREPSPIEDDDYSLDLLLGEVFGTEIDQTPPLAPRKKMVTTTAQLEEDGDADPRDTNQTKEDNQTRGTSRQTRRKTRDDSAQMELLEEIVDLSPETGRTTVPSTRAVSTMTMTMTEDEDRGEPAEGIRRQEEEQEPAEGIRQQEKESSPQSFPSYSPKEQRPSRRAREPSPIEDDDYSLDLLLGEVFGTEIDQTPPLAPRKKMVTTTAQVHRNPTQEDLMDLEEPDSENWGTSATSTPQPHKFVPITILFPIPFPLCGS
ncbi:hypothetical protein PAMA_022060 [Pampus argenteus]